MIGVAIKIVEKTPAITPINIARAKSLIDPPQKMKSTKVAINVVNEVRIVRLNV